MTFFSKQSNYLKSEMEKKTSLINRFAMLRITKILRPYPKDMGVTIW